VHEKKKMCNSASKQAQRSVTIEHQEKEAKTLQMKPEDKENEGALPNAPQKERR